MRTFLLLAVSLIACYAANISEMKQLFEEYNQRHGKVHASAIEKEERFQAFMENAMKLDDLNKQNPHAFFGFTKFADMTAEEFSATHTRFTSTNIITPNFSLGGRAAAPTEGIDWRTKGATSPVKEQGQCGSGVDYAAVETVESANLIKKKPLTIGSIEEIVACASNNSGCEGNWDPVEVFNWVIKQGGLESQACYGTGVHPDQGCMVGKNKCPNPDPNLKLTAIFKVSHNEEAMYNALKLAPLFICVDASQWQMYEGGILTQCSAKSIDHCVQLVGYSPSQGGYWIAKNSWGTSWGESGYIYLKYGDNACGLTTMPIHGADHSN